MKLKKIQVDFSQVKNLEEMHEALAQVFGFPDFYGKNVNALIDCWSSLRFPEDEMTKIIVAKDEFVLLEAIGIAQLDQLMMNHFMISVVSVNERSLDQTGQPLIILVPM